LQKMIHPEDDELLLQKIRTAIQNGEVVSNEIRFFSSNENLRWIDVRGRMLSNGENIPRKLIGITQNITGRKRREKLEQEKSRRLKYIGEDRPLEVIFTELCENVPQLSLGVRASIMLADEERAFFKEPFAPDLSPAWSEDLEGASVSDLM